MLPRALTEAGMVLRLTRDLRSFLASSITGAEAAETVRRELPARDERFLAMVEASIFGHPRSPYRWLLGIAGCTLGDIRIGRDGRSGTLMAGAWARAEAVTVRRAHPIATPAGKILPLHLVAGDAAE
jgi:hypothetical protein